MSYIKNEQQERVRPTELLKDIDIWDTPEGIAKALQSYNELCLELFLQADHYTCKDVFRLGYFYIKEMAESLNPQYKTSNMES